MRRVFADAWFYIALLDRNDAGHQKARAICADESITGFVTTRWVLMEVGNMLAGSKARLMCAAFLDELGGMAKIVPDSDSLFRRGLELYRNRPDKTWSLTDCVSFVVMNDEGLSEALTGDHHFSQAGFIPLFA